MTLDNEENYYEEEFKNRLRKARDGEIEETLDEQAAALCYEVGVGHGMQELSEIGWKTVLEWKEEIEGEALE